MVVVDGELPAAVEQHLNRISLESLHVGIPHGAFVLPIGLFEVQIVAQPQEELLFFFRNGKENEFRFVRAKVGTASRAEREGLSLQTDGTRE